ncbi:MAG TPA: hypothetical protein VIJ53_01635 [Acidobacteriaceae bacterium]|jgi:hypothetical protein
MAVIKKVMLETKSDVAVDVRKMLNFCGCHNIVRGVALIPIEKVGEAVSAISKASRESISPSTGRPLRSIRMQLLYAVGAWN